MKLLCDREVHCLHFFCLWAMFTDQDTNEGEKRKFRYIQAPLAYPRERKRSMNGGENWLPFCIYSDGEFLERMSPCYWSDYYSVSPRTPNVTELAPWVARFYHRT